MVSASIDRRERPRKPRGVKGKGWAFILAVAVQLAFVAVLVFSVQWQRRPPEAVSVELYAPPVKAPQPTPTPPPPPKVEPKPEPVPPPAPKPPEPVAEKPDQRAADIALKAKQERERKEQDERQRKLEQERIAREQAKLAEDKRKADEQRKAVEKQKELEKQQAEAKERERRQQQELAALRAQADREKQLREQAAREQAERQAQQAAAGAARSKAEADWIRRIQAKVKGNVIVPPDLAGNPTAIFDVVQLPTGEILQATLRKSSGNRAYDDAVQRAIMKSSPLPRPDRADLFQRELRLEFRPVD